MRNVKHKSLSKLVVDPRLKRRHFLTWKAAVILKKVNLIKSFQSTCSVAVFLEFLWLVLLPSINLLAVLGKNRKKNIFVYLFAI